ncbi:hypothetical protein BJY21_001833 [Kineosphaera limosa]|nr:LytR C-terminal domain-containing protein [Kineosphaera limosa]NYE00649.1 hypothetical protein [Kineosphaera limosa]
MKFFGRRPSISAGRAQRRRQERRRAGWLRRNRRLGIAAFVSVPAVALGTVTMAGAYGYNLMSSSSPTCTPQVVRAPERDSFRLTVLNASGYNGKATPIGKELLKRGFDVAEVGTVPSGGLMSGQGTINYGADGRDQALLVAAQVKGANLHFDGRQGPSVSFVIGGTFPGLVEVPPPPPPLPQEVTVNVYNTTFRSGLATDVSNQLTDRGFVTGKYGNDPDNGFLPDDVAVIRYGEDGAEGARLVAQHVPGARLQQVPRVSKSVDVVLGNRFEQLTDTALVPTPPPVEPAPPETVTRPC